MKLIKLLENYLFGYTFLEDLEGSFNKNIKVKRNLTGSLWAGKISKSLRYHAPEYKRDLDFKDFDDRAILAYRLADLVGVNTLVPKIIRAERIKGWDIKEVSNRLNDFVFLTEFNGPNLRQYLNDNNFQSLQESDIKNPESIIDDVVFHLWIGNYDKKDNDYLVDVDKTITSIDHQLSGPGFRQNKELALGGWGEGYSISTPEDTGWCTGDKIIINYLKDNNFPISKYLKTINRIKQLSRFDIVKCFQGLNFYRQGTNEQINDEYIDFLLSRRDKLEGAIQSWIVAGYPLREPNKVANPYY